MSRAPLCRYSEILQLGASGISACKLLCNRSRAYAGALRYNEALQAMLNLCPTILSVRLQSMLASSTHSHEMQQGGMQHQADALNQRYRM